VTLPTTRPWFTYARSASPRRVRRQAPGRRPRSRRSSAADRGRRDCCRAASRMTASTGSALPAGGYVTTTPMRSAGSRSASGASGPVTIPRSRWATRGPSVYAISPNFTALRRRLPKRRNPSVQDTDRAPPGNTFADALVVPSEQSLGPAAVADVVSSSTCSAPSSRTTTANARIADFSSGPDPRNLGWG